MASRAYFIYDQHDSHARQTCQNPCIQPLLAARALKSALVVAHAIRMPTTEAITECFSQTTDESSAVSDRRVSVLCRIVGEMYVFQQP